MLRILPAVLAATLTCGPAWAEPHVAPPCPTLEESRAAATEQTAGQGSITHLDGADARRYLEAFNSLGPKSHASASHISIMILPKRNMAMVILDDCQCGGLKSAIIVPPGLAQAAFDLALGERT